ncbi:MAG: DnaJ domain-containing protein [Actinomycetia bacterium]|nr:DnaJ domain-containing protein [Actinomycetes bacterium]
MGARSLLTGNAVASAVCLNLLDGRELAMRRARAAGGKGAVADPGLERTEPATEFEREFSAESLFCWGNATVLTTDPLEDAYEMLGVNRDTPWSEITSIYRAMAGEHHPDRGGDPALMVRINEAHALIRFAHGEH